MTARHVLCLLAVAGPGLLVAAGLGAVPVWAGVALLVLAVVLAMFLEGLSFLARKAEHAALDAMGARVASLETAQASTEKVVRTIREQVTLRE